MNYNKLNNIVGWSVFGIAFFVYLFSMAQTASFWDCGEFIACANELEVPHPPGAPFYLLLGRVFALFSFGNVENVAFMINMMSVLSGAFTVLFTFWIITHLSKKIVAPNLTNPDKSQTIAIMFAGAVGGLACTFTDSFWFNTVEAEVYAMSSFFTAAVVWLIFKWESRADQAHNLRYIILIAFVMGISVGVHLLNLLTIPALAAIYYTRKSGDKFTWVGMGVSLLAGVGILVFILYGMLNFGVEVGWWFEQFFTGTESFSGAQETGMGMARGTGIIIYLLLIVGALVGGIYFTAKRKMANLHAALLSIVMITIGYSSYAMIVIRANANPPINENDPSSTTTFLSYLKREQYGDSPLLSGVRYNDVQKYKAVKKRKNYIQLNEPMGLKDGTYKLADGKSVTVKSGKAVGFSAEPTDGDEARMELEEGGIFVYNTKTKDAGKLHKRYVWDGYKQDLEYDSRYKVFFPRMHSGSHYDVAPYGYKSFVKRKGMDLKSPFDDQPTFSEDMKFFMEYQVVHMYWRYFMWNFAGREGDIQDDSWESGINVFKTSSMPDSMADHPGKNHFFFLPLLLGLFGLVFQFSTKKLDAFNMLLLFFFTGIAIILYLNQTPTQPRERDYSYAGSFQTFAIWIGLGVIGLYSLVKDILEKAAPYATGVVCLILVPGIMGWQGWDDHTRRQRYIAPDSAYNLLNSCEKNGILFTNGDNDTFPLWYIQEVEGVRTDVRVVNLSLLNTDWYIDQMKYPSNESPALPISLKQVDYIGDKNSFQQFPKGKEISLKVDKKKVLENGTVEPEYANQILSPMPWKVRTRGGQNSYILKQDWLILDILINNANNGWERPIYFSSTIPPSSYMNLVPYFQVEGLAYRVVPVAFPSPEKDPCNTDPYRQGHIQKDVCYEKVMETFKYRGLDNENLYLDDHIRRTIIGNMRSTIFRTANAYADDANCLERDIQRIKTDIARAQATEGNEAVVDSLTRLIAQKQPTIEKNKRMGLEVLEMAHNKIPYTTVEADPIFLMFSGQAFRRLGNQERSLEYYSYVVKMVRETLGWYASRDEKFRGYDRYLSTLGFIEKEAMEMKNFDLAADVNEALYEINGQQQYMDKANQLRQGPKEGGRPQPVNPPAPK